MSNLKQILQLLWTSWGPQCTPAQLPAPLGLWFGVDGVHRNTPPASPGRCALHRLLSPSTAPKGWMFLPHYSHVCNQDMLPIISLVCEAVSKNPASSLSTRSGASSIFHPNKQLAAELRLACLCFGAGEERQKTGYNVCFVPSDKR